MPQHKGGKKNRKHGRNTKWCQSYRARGQREINKAKKAAKHAARLAKQGAGPDGPVSLCCTRDINSPMWYECCAANGESWQRVDRRFTSD